MISQLENAGIEIVRNHMHGIIARNNGKTFAIFTESAGFRVYRAAIEPSGDYQLIGGKVIKTAKNVVKFIKA